MNQSAVIAVVRKAKTAHDHGRFGTLEQTEFFKEIAVALTAVAPAPTPAPAKAPQKTAAPSPKSKE
jgi:hypothetical protein